MHSFAMDKKTKEIKQSLWEEMLERESQVDLIKDIECIRDAVCASEVKHTRLNDENFMGYWKQSKLYAKWSEEADNPPPGPVIRRPSDDEPVVLPSAHEKKKRSEVPGVLAV